MGKRGERIVGWKAIAAALGVGVELAKKRIHRAGVSLPKLKRDGRTSPVYATFQALEVVLRPLFRDIGKAV